MAHDRKLEPLPDGFTAFHTADGERWKHKDVGDSRVGPGYRLFVSDRGEQRRYEFGPSEPHDATLSDLREQLGRARPFTPTADDPATGDPAAGEATMGGATPGGAPTGGALPSDALGG
jgi:hypothetical protein